jgi:hypothetical protein
MPRRNDISKNLIIGLLLMDPFVFGQGKTSSPKFKLSLAAHCAPDLDRAAERIFANPGGKEWKEYAAMKQVPRLDGNNREVTMTVKASSSGKHYVRTIEYGEDSAHYEGNCYDEAGTLRSMHYEMRTAWGWGYEDIRGFDGAGKLRVHTIRYFNTSNHAKIGRPSQADDVPDFLKPTIYRSFDSLPFIPTLKASRINATP